MLYSRLISTVDARPTVFPKSRFEIKRLLVVLLIVSRLKTQRGVVCRRTFPENFRTYCSENTALLMSG